MSVTYDIIGVFGEKAWELLGADGGSRDWHLPDPGRPPRIQENDAMTKTFRILLMACIASLVAMAAMAADRHVYLDTNNDGTLNDCPNPAHNAKGSSNTDEMQRCSGGTQNGKIIGTASGRISASACVSGGGAVSFLSSRNTTADVDGDGALESVYGHPQACVWNMGLSDSCEIHAGTYKLAGAVATAAVGDDSSAVQDISGCNYQDCWFGSIAATGLGPNLSDNGYGTKANPAYIRGAVMGGSTDTWDSNNNKRPDSSEGVASYPAIISGDRDRDGITGAGDRPTAWSGDTIPSTGDSVLMTLVGLGDRNGSGAFSKWFSSPDYETGEHGLRLDTNADGTFDVELGSAGGSGYTGVKKVNYLTLKDLEFKDYTHGPAPGTGTLQLLPGINTWNGDGASVGLVGDHLYMHDYPYSLDRNTQTMWALFGDYLNKQCRPAGDPNNYQVVKNSLLYWQNVLVFQNDNSPGSWTGCPWSIHDNRIISKITQTYGASPVARLEYIKGIDVIGPDNRKKVERLYNNEIILDVSAVSPVLADLQVFGNAQGFGLGEWWVYGNLIRPMSGGTLMSPMHPGFCSGGAPDSSTTSGRYYLFNNTLDFDRNVGNLCGNQGSGNKGELIVDMNNAFYMGSARDPYPDGTNAFTTVRRSDNCHICTSGCSSGPDDCATNTKSNWFADTTTPATYWNGFTLYAPKAGGELDGAGTCDPDGDGTPGVDYDGDGTNDTSWLDIAGNLIQCPSTTTPIAIGAVQVLRPPDTNPPGDVGNLRRTDTRP